MQVTLQIQKNKQINDLQIRNAKYKIQKINNKSNSDVSSAAISNNLNFIIVGGSDCELNIWKYRTNDRIKSIRFNDVVSSCKFTQDSQFLYVGIGFQLHQFYVNNNFKKLCEQDVDGYDEYAGYIHDILCISKTIILTSFNQIIIKTDVIKKQQLLKIQAIHNHSCGFDYNSNFNLIASGSAYGSIMSWSGHDGTLRIEKVHAHNHYRPIFQVLFIMNNNQLTSLDIAGNVRIWTLNFQTDELESFAECFAQINQCGTNMSLVHQQQYLIITGRQFIKIITIRGEFVRIFEHQLDTTGTNIYKIRFYNTIQHDSMKVVLILGQENLYVCKIELD